MNELKPYMVSMPTMGRRVILEECVMAFAKQTHPPKVVLLIDNNEKPIAITISETIGKTQVRVVMNDYQVPGIIQGDATGLRYARANKFDLVARWDDDLLPEPDCMERLVRLHNIPNVVATGGMYPAPDNKHPVFGERFSSVSNPGGGSPRHLQFFPWQGPDTLIQRHFLYSSFVYNTLAAIECGGFCTEYSQHSYRADTDFTLRMAMRGKLLVDTAAVAIHHVKPGGTRNIVGKEKEEMMTHDLLLFDTRMRAMGIDPNY